MGARATRSTASGCRIGAEPYLDRLYAGRSSQATLLGRDDVTIESLYLSPSLADELAHVPIVYRYTRGEQLCLMEGPRLMAMNELPPEFIARCRAVTAKQPRTVIDHILKHGYITTEELKEQYGYNHPPRAARDVREQGIPLETYRVTGSDGRKIGAYRFGDPAKVRYSRLSGRTAFGFYSVLLL